MFEKLTQTVFGKARNWRDPGIFHQVSLMSFLAWVGLGADGLSSSAYGPDEAYRALGQHTHLALLLVAMTALTIVVISIAYSNLIEHFPGGGGGYLVASKLLGEKAGVVSGCALLVDYVLTISVSIASGCDALWSFFPPSWVPFKLATEFAVLIFMMGLNLRGVKESVSVLAPVFMIFIVTHAFMIVYAIGHHATALPTVFQGAASDFRSSISTLGWIPVLSILLRAYSLGGGTYTGIEAVSNGVSMLREPRVRTAKRTMALMAGSLAFTAAGILFGYLLTNAMPQPGKTMNAVLLENLFGHWSGGQALIVISLVAESALLFVAAQAGFLDGPRILSNMARDSWMPHRFADLSNRLVTKNGILLMGIAAIGTLIYTKGDITTLVVMYSINVFLTFSLTELGMASHWIKSRHTAPNWKQQLTIHATGLLMCTMILCVTLVEKFGEGGWITACITVAVIFVSFRIRQHYEDVRRGFRQLDEVLKITDLPPLPEPRRLLDRTLWTAILPVTEFSGFGIHHLLAIRKYFPDQFKNVIFVSVGVIDSGVFKGAAEIETLETRTRLNAEKYVRWCIANKLPADYRITMATEAVPAINTLCRDIAKEFPKSVVFTGKLIFRRERWFQRILHNETAFSIQRELQLDGIPTMVLPIRA